MATLDWGTGQEMNAIEALMWRAEVDPRLRSTMVAVEILDCEPDWDRFFAAHEWGSRMVPRFRRRVAEPVIAGGPPRWVLDEDLDLDYHVRRVRVPAGAGVQAALELAQQLAMRPFDRARPPWEAVLYEGLPGGRAAYALKLHHSSTDGIGAIQLLAGLHRRSRASDPDKPQPPAPAPEPRSLSGELVRDAARETRGVAGALAQLGGGALGGLLHPERSVRDAVGFASSLRRVLADPPASPSPLLSGRSLSWRFIALDVQFADLRAAAKAGGGTINDAFLAALLGAFRRYHAELDCPIDAMPVAIPISVRQEGDAAGGNRFVPARLAGPVGIADPTERMAAVHELVKGARAEPAMAGLALLAPALARLPPAVIARLAGAMATGNDLQASNVPGIRETVYMAGARVERLYPFAPLPGCAAMISLVTHGDVCCVGANVDAAAIEDPERFARCLKEGFDEVLALSGSAGRATPPS